MSPRPIQKPAAPQPSGEAASYILNRLMSEGRLSASDMTRYFNDMHSEIAELESRLTNLRSIAGNAPTARPPAPKAAAPARKAAAPAAAPKPAAAEAAPKAAAPRKRRSKSSAAVLESQKLQGRYIRAIKKVPADKRDYYKQMAKDKGREAAVLALEAL